MRFHDAGVLRLLGVVAYQQLFIQLFAWAQTRHLDGNVALRVVRVLHRQTRQRHHAARQIHNLHRLPHIEHKHIAARAHGARLNHQLRRLGYGHKVTRHLGIGQRDWATFFNLLAEQWHDRAARTQHIAKAHHREAGSRPARRSLLGQRLQHHLG